jgi:hypothetical protein
LLSLLTQIFVPLVFGVIVFVGAFGNVLVITVVATNQVQTADAPDQGILSEGKGSSTVDLLAGTNSDQLLLILKNYFFLCLQSKLS